MKKLLSISALAFLITLTQCIPIAENNNQSGTQNAENKVGLPPAYGPYDDLLVLADSAILTSSVKTALDKTFRSPLNYLLKPEPYFKTKYIYANNFNDVLKKHRNIAVVIDYTSTTPGGLLLRQFLTPELEKAFAQNTNNFFHEQNNIYANGQHVLFFFTNNPDSLSNKILNNAQKLRDKLWLSERIRYADYVYRNKKNNNEKELNQKWGIWLPLPDEYEKAKFEDDFRWYRKMGPQSDINIVVANYTYTGPSDVSDESFKTLRKITFGTRITGSGNPSDTASRVITETELPLISEEINLNNQYAKAFYGAWKLADNSQGGAFIALLVPNARLKKLFYIEGFIYAPGIDKRMLIKEVEAILWNAKSL